MNSDFLGRERNLSELLHKAFFNNEIFRVLEILLSIVFGLPVSDESLKEGLSNNHCEK
jgi:hypothetical protein